MNSKKFISTLLYLTILSQNNLYSNKIKYQNIYSLNLNQQEEKYILPLIIFKGEKHKLFNKSTEKQIYQDMKNIIQKNNKINIETIINKYEKSFNIFNKIGFYFVETKIKKSITNMINLKNELDKSNTNQKDYTLKNYWNYYFSENTNIQNNNSKKTNLIYKKLIE